MLNKKSIKIIGIVLFVALLLATVASTACFAANIPSPDPAVKVGGIETTVKTILGIIQWAGFAIAVGMAMFVGIKYVTSSPDGKAEIKKTLTIYILGIVLIASASAIVGIISNNLEIKDTTVAPTASISVVEDVA